MNIRTKFIATCIAVNGWVILDVKVNLDVVWVVGELRDVTLTLLLSNGIVPFKTIGTFSFLKRSLCRDRNALERNDTVVKSPITEALCLVGGGRDTHLSLIVSLTLFQ